MPALHLSGRSGWLGYATAPISVGAITALIGLLQGSLGASNLSVLYLLAVLGEAIAFGRGPAITTCAASFLAFNWFFVEPLHTLTVARPEEWAALLVFLAVAAIASELAAGQRLRAQEAEQREREAEVLYDVVRLMSEPDLDTALRAVAERLLGALDLAAVGIEIPEAGDASHWVAAGDPTATQALRSSGALPPERVRAIPVKAADRLGKVVLLSKPDGPRLLPADERLLSAVATQIGLAMERRRLRREANEAEILRRADDLKTSLLNAVSHDLRTPLSSIIASAGSLLQKDVAWSGQERREFARAIDEEARRLNRIVTNLLNLSRINSGNLQPDRGWYDLGALVEEVLGRLRPVTARHRVSTYVQEDLPPVLLDYVEIDQVLSNLVENATEYAPAGTGITVSVHKEEGWIRVEVADQGPGVPAELEGRIFEPFSRARSDRRTQKGTGLGLAVARGLVEAHGGKIWFRNLPGGGAAFSFTLPAASEAAPSGEAVI